jgi:two-component system response regulator YesN
MNTICIVDDEPLVREGLARSVNWRSFRLKVTGVYRDGLEALAAVRRDVPDVLLTDIRMPGLDGIELARVVKQEYPHVVLVFLTGYGEFEYARTAVSLGAAEYLLKPVSDEALHAILRRVTRLVSGMKRDAEERDTLHRRMECIRRAHVTLPRPPADAPGAARAPKRRIREVMAYIRANYMQDITLGVLARTFRLSPSYLSRAFSLEAGESFCEFLTRCRVETAGELLADPTLRIYEVSDLVGYHCEKYFARVFKSATGMSPGEYRDRLPGDPKVTIVHHLAKS